MSALPRPPIFRFTLTPESIYRTDSGIPPETPPTKPTNGNYCFRVSNELKRSSSDEELTKFIGYSQDISIVEKVEKTCKRHSGRTSGTECTPPRLYFIGAHPKCDGRVEVEKP